MRFGGRRAQCHALTIVVLATLAAWLAVEPAACKRAASRRRNPEARVWLDALDRDICGRRLAKRPAGLFAEQPADELEDAPSWPDYDDGDGDNEEEEAEDEDYDDQQAAQTSRRPGREGARERLAAGTGNRLAVGSPAYAGEFPWWTGLVVSFGGTTLRNCGAVIIHRTLVLTAAHCITHVSGKEPLYVEVFAGLFNAKHFATRQVVRARRWTRDRAFQKISIRYPLAVEFGHDLALVELERELHYNDYVQPACLPANSSEPLRNERGCMLAGMGMTHGMRQSEELLAMPVVPCRPGEFVTDGRLDETCYKTADAQNFPGRACVGDSGSSVVCPDDAARGDEARFYATGVVSWGPQKGCERGRIELTIFGDLRKQNEHLLEMAHQMVFG